MVFVLAAIGVVVVVTCEIKFFRNYLSLRRHPSETILPEIISK